MQIDKLLDAFQFEAPQWLNFAVFQDASYARILLHSSVQCSIMLLCWSPGQTSPVHGHGFREFSWIKMLQGVLVQRLYRVEDGENVEFSRFQSL